jgi:hypothetical protein
MNNIRFGGSLNIRCSVRFCHQRLSGCGIGISKKNSVYFRIRDSEKKETTIVFNNSFITLENKDRILKVNITLKIRKKNKALCEKRKMKRHFYFYANNDPKRKKP